MKAIAFTNESKTVDSGHSSRAERSVAGFGFDDLLALTGFDFPNAVNEQYEDGTPIQIEDRMAADFLDLSHIEAARDQSWASHLDGRRLNVMVAKADQRQPWPNTDEDGTPIQIENRMPADFLNLSHIEVGRNQSELGHLDGLMLNVMVAKVDQRQPWPITDEDGTLIQIEDRMAADFLDLSHIEAARNQSWASHLDGLIPSVMVADTAQTQPWPIRGEAVPMVFVNSPDEEHMPWLGSISAEILAADAGNLTKIDPVTIDPLMEQNIMFAMPAPIVDGQLEAQITDFTALDLSVFAGKAALLLDEMGHEALFTNRTIIAHRTATTPMDPAEALLQSDSNQAPQVNSALQSGTLLADIETSPERAEGVVRRMDGISKLAAQRPVLDEPIIQKPGEYLTAAPDVYTPRLQKPGWPIAPTFAQGMVSLAPLDKSGKIETPISEKSVALFPAEVTSREESAQPDLIQAATEQAESFSSTGSGVRAPTVRAPMPALLPSTLPLSATLNMRQADWNERLVEHIERTVNSGLGRIELSLRPKNLGEIQVLIRIQNEETTVQIITETAAAARMLHGGEDRLAQVLDQSGYRLSGFLAQEHGLGAKGGQQGQQGQSSPRRNQPLAEAAQREEASEVATKSIYHTGRNNGSGINMLA